MTAIAETPTNENAPVPADNTARLAELYSQYRNNIAAKDSMDPVVFDKEMRKLRAKIRTAGGSVRVLTGDIDPAVAAAIAPPPRSAGASGEPKAKRARKGKKGHTAEVTAVPASAEEIAAVKLALTESGLTFQTVAEMESQGLFGYGVDLLQGVTLDVARQRFADRFNGAQPEWYTLHEPAAEGSVTLLVLGPVSAEHTAPAAAAVEATEDEDLTDGEDDAEEDEDEEEL